MIAFKDVQHDAATTIAADAFFAGLAVIEDLGTEANDVARETALNGAGFCVTVAPLLLGVLSGQSFSKAIVETTVPVLVESNPKKNTTVNLYEATSAVVQALFGRGPINPNDNYRLAPNSFEFSDIDPGVFGYLVLFQKKCQI